MKTIIQIINISATVMFEMSKGEHKMLEQMNATVSHDMREPINSLQCQFTVQEHLTKRLYELIHDKSIKKVSQMKKGLKNIHRR